MPSESPDPAALSDDQLREVHRDVAAGSLIVAIKRYREFTGVGLKEAKDAVEAMRDHWLTHPFEPAAGPPANPAAVGRPAAPNGAAAPWRAEAEQLVLAGKKIQAVKLIRDATDLGLKESLDIAESIQAEVRRKDPQKDRSADAQMKKGGGCLGAVAVAVALVAAAGTLVARYA